MKTLAERLKHARDLRGLSQAQLAKLAKCRQSTIGNAEAGIRKRLANVVTVARVLDVSADWLADGRGPAPTLLAAEPAAPYRLPRWLFSHELFVALADRSAADLRRAENCMRAFLDLPSLPAAEGNDRAA